MKHIAELTGIGTGKSCIIIGGGLSVRDIDLSKIPTDWTIIGLNNHCINMAEIIFYYDTSMATWFNKRGIRQNQLLIGMNMDRPGAKYLSLYCTHYYGYYDCAHGDIGFRALQFVDQIFDYGKIYLAGYDYSTNGESYHFEDETSDEYLMNRFKVYSIGVILPLYANMEVKNSVYNLSKISKIERFKKCNILDKTLQ